MDKTTKERVAAFNWLVILPLIFKFLQAIFGAFSSASATWEALPQAARAELAQKLAAAVGGFDWGKINWQKIFEIIMQFLEMFGAKNGDGWPTT